MTPRNENDIRLLRAVNDQKRGDIPAIRWEAAIEHNYIVYTDLFLDPAQAGNEDHWLDELRLLNRIEQDATPLRMIGPVELTPEGRRLYGLPPEA